jgi:hypothetical protein
MSCEGIKPTYFKSKVTPGTAVNCVAAFRLFAIKPLRRRQFREFLPCT